MHYTALVIASNIHDLCRLLDPYADNPIDKSFITKFYDYEKDEYFDYNTGNEGTWCNPNAKWDWFEIGGRWNNQIVTIAGEHVNFCKIREIDTSRSFSGSGFITHTVVTPDREWHEGPFSWKIEEEKEYQEWHDNFYSRFILPYFSKYGYLIDYHY